MRSKVSRSAIAGRSLGGSAVDAREPLDHLAGCAKHRLAVAAPLALAPVERGTAADRDERVLEQCAPRGVRVDVSRRDRLDTEVLGEVPERDVPSRVASLVRALKLDEEPLSPERGGEPGSAVRVAERQARRGRSRRGRRGPSFSSATVSSGTSGSSSTRCSLPSGLVPACAAVRIRQRLA